MNGHFAGHALAHLFATIVKVNKVVTKFTFFLFGDSTARPVRTCGIDAAKCVQDAISRSVFSDCDNLSGIRAGVAIPQRLASESRDAGRKTAHGPNCNLQSGPWAVIRVEFQKPTSSGGPGSPLRTAPRHSGTRSRRADHRFEWCGLNSSGPRRSPPAARQPCDRCST